MDRDQVVAAQRGDREAYAGLLRSLGDRLYAIAYRIRRDVDRTEDALQEALVTACLHVGAVVADIPSVVGPYTALWDRIRASIELTPETASANPHRPSPSG